MYGAADVYYVTDDVVNTGSYSLRMDLAGRNQWCNACGSKTVNITQSDISSSCISVTGSPWQGTLYNKTNGFSRWDIVSSDDSKVCFDGSSSIGDSMFGSAENAISAGDEIKIPYMCGVNGIVGGGSQPSRRSDCDKVINYFENVAPTDLGYGETLSRRFHMYIPSAAVLPGITLKLGYTHWRREGESVRSVKLKLSVQRDLRLELNMPNSETFLPDYYMEKDKWYYYEELFVRESSEGAGDAEYHLYFGTLDDNIGEPIVSRTGFNIGALVDISMHGNWQHNNDVSGYIYFDDILISDGYAGPEGYNRPLAPVGLNVRVN